MESSYQLAKLHNKPDKTSVELINNFKIDSRIKWSRFYQAVDAHYFWVGDQSEEPHGIDVEYQRNGTADVVRYWFSPASVNEKSFLHLDIFERERLFAVADSNSLTFKSMPASRFTKGQNNFIGNLMILVIGFAILMFIFWVASLIGLSGGGECMPSRVNPC